MLIDKALVSSAANHGYIGKHGSVSMSCVWTAYTQLTQSHTDTQLTQPHTDTQLTLAPAYTQHLIHHFLYHPTLYSPFSLSPNTLFTIFFVTFSLSYPTPYSTFSLPYTHLIHPFPLAKTLFLHFTSICYCC